MKIIVSSQIPLKAKKKLAQFGEVLFLDKQAFLYDSIASHPDIYFCQIENQLVVAPNIPNEWETWLLKNEVSYQKGISNLQEKYPQTAHYNAVVTSEFLIHNLKVTDASILEISKIRNEIHVNQAYTRCNLVPLNKDHFITSDKGIEKRLKLHLKKVLYIDPFQIRLAGQKNGFFGGCCGIFEDKLFLSGNLSSLRESKELINFTSSLSIEIIELSNEPMMDIGSVLFLKSGC